MRIKKLTAGACVFALAMGSAAPAIAFDCMVAKKPAGAGAIGTFDDATGEFTPSKPNPGTFEKPHGAFVAFTDGEQSGSTFIHAPQGVMPPVREGGSQANCDGKGLDSIELCSGP